jgi:hypothetical protein
MRSLRRALPALMLLALPLLVAASPTPSTIELSVDHGPPGRHVTITGRNFLPNEQIPILFDNAPVNRATADGQGNFTAEVVVPDTTQGTHTICARLRCANFTVTAPATPTPTPPPTPPPTPEATPTPQPTPTPTDTPTPSPTGSATATPAAIAGTSTGSSGGGLLRSLFPGILIPILLLLAVGGAALFLILRNRTGGGGLPPPYRAGPQPPGPPGGRPGQMTVTHRAPTPGGVGPIGPPTPGTPPGPPPPPPPAQSVPTGPPSGGWGLPSPPTTPLPPPAQGPRAVGGDDSADLPQPGD